jgi:hypothetical protein
MARWRATRAIKIHYTMDTCTKDPGTGAAACQSAISAEAVLEALADVISEPALAAAE